MPYSAKSVFLDTLQNDHYEEYLEFYKNKVVLLDRNVNENDAGLLEQSMNMIGRMANEIAPTVNTLDQLNVDPVLLETEKLETKTEKKQLKK